MSDVADADTVAASEPAMRGSEPTLAVGRFRIERELGRGGMGIVYAAFDPNLERRVALKLLRGRGGDTTARLVREARAMARLSHPNVVTVHEVGELEDRAYFVMELVEGVTLGEWLRAKHGEREILDAFLAAGRGLAAAHAVGLVHRDFKPQNVLRSIDGRIVVTDFGLARTEEISRASKPVLEAKIGTTTPSTPLEGLTETGSVVGTPGYMAPEQWDGTISAASDQFAFCVALWEAFAGTRPYRGVTVEELLTSIVQGPASLDASRIPVQLRAPLLRGLDPDPAKRWPSMQALLGALAPRRRRWAIPVALGAAALATTIVLALVLSRDGASCAPALLEPPDMNGLAITKHQASLVTDVMTRWRSARARACALAEPESTGRRSCLDAVLARNDAVVRALRTIPTPEKLELGYALVDPEICELPAVPRLVASTSAAYRTAIEHQVNGLLNLSLYLPAPAPREIQIPDEPCAAAVARSAALFRSRDADTWAAGLVELRRSAEACGDDRLLADVALTETRFAFSNGLADANALATLERAEVAVARVAQPSLVASLHYYRAVIAHADNRLADAKREIEQSRALMERARHLRGEGYALLQQIRLLASGDGKDIEAVRPLVEKFRARAALALAEDDPMMLVIDGQRAVWRLFHDGDVAGANAQLEALRAKQPPLAPTDPITVRGKVRSVAGAPVANAIVVAGPRLVGDSRHVSLALPETARSLRRVQTDATGAFELVVERGATIIASHGDQRSLPARVAPTVELVVEPTSELSGKVDLGGVHSTIASFDVHLADTETIYQLVGPVRRDGSFSLAGVPRRAVEVHVSYVSKVSVEDVFARVDVKEPRVTGISLDLRSEQRELFIIVRSSVQAYLEGARAAVAPGAAAPATKRELDNTMRLTSAPAKLSAPESLPREVVAQMKQGDLVARFAQVPVDAGTVCAHSALRATFTMRDDAEMEAAADRFEARCKPLARDTKVVVLEVPPPPRLD